MMVIYLHAIHYIWLELGGREGSLLQQLLGPGASAPTAASHQPTGENIILIHTMMGQSLIHNQKFPSHGNICFNDNIELKYYFKEISLPFSNSSPLWKK